MWRNTSLGAAALALTIAVVGSALSADQSGTGTTGNGGAGGAGVGGMSTGTMGSGGASGTCTKAEECVAFGDACNQGACVNGMCSKLPDMTRENAACDDGLY